MHFGILAFPETFDSDPMHGPSVTGIFLSDKRNVILHGAGSRTGLAARADILVDDHAPNAICFFGKCTFRAHTI